ncbi:MAG: hypothetical protein K6B74_03140 [Ruminococcus sp.]|nr:hypothetical protein [Ruminococcus sp.]
MKMKNIIAAAVAAAVLASLSACGQTAEAASAANTEYLYGKIDSVSGNDIVLLLADYKEESTDGSETEESADKSEENAGEGSDAKKSRDFSRPDKGEMPEGFDPSKFEGEMPEGFDPSKFDGERPARPPKSEDGESGEGSDGDGAGTTESGSEKKSRSFPKFEDGEMPDGFDPSKLNGERPARPPKSEDGDSADSSTGEEGSGKSGSGKSKSFGGKSGGSKYTLTGEQEELRIPVGVTVTTSLGVKTDFDALSAGDLIKCSIEKNDDGSNVVTEVWILEN